MEVMKLRTYHELAYIKEFMRKHAPEDTEDAIVEVHQADVCSGNPDVKDVDDELVPRRVLGELQAVELEVAFRLCALLREHLALKLLDLVRETTGLDHPIIQLQSFGPA